VLAAVGCAAPRPLVPVRDGRDATIGCYALVQGKWSQTNLWRDSTQRDSTILPRVIQLHPTGRVTPSVPLAGPRFAALEGTWRTAGRDSLLIAWSDGANYITLSLVPYVDSLAGRASIVPDAGGIESPIAHVEATRRSCA
jgi:hypothetical protein